VVDRRRRSGIRLRTTAAAVAVVAAALAAGGVAQVLMLRASLTDGLAAGADDQASKVVEQLEAGADPASVLGSTGYASKTAHGGLEPEDQVTQLTTTSTPGRVLASSDPGYVLPRRVVGEDEDAVELPGADHTYLVRSKDAEVGDEEYVVTVAASRDAVDDATAALLPPLLVGLPLLLLVAGAVTSLVVARTLAPVERIRAEVDGITDRQLHRRVPEPAAQDEVGRLARTMNAMLTRLEDAQTRQRRFVSDASHELRSPVATLRQSAEVAQAHPEVLPVSELAEIVQAESARMQRLVDQLLVLTRADEGRIGDLSEVDVDDLLFEEAARLRRAGLRVDSSAVQHVRTYADRRALTQVVRNLVDNAAHHSTGRVDLSLAAEDGFLLLSVRDDGPGVPAPERERIFDRFVRLDDARHRDGGGSGLGLAIVRDLLIAAGGDVTVSDAGPGAVFVVRLPLRRASAAAPALP
jgi:signal transduction histidine kinase